MTALVSTFSRAYHSENNDVKIFNDSVAKLLLSEQEYKEITEQYFAEYNRANPQHIMSAFDNVNYCLAIKKLFWGQAEEFY